MKRVATGILALILATSSPAEEKQVIVGRDYCIPQNRATVKEDDVLYFFGDQSYLQVTDFDEKKDSVTLTDPFTKKNYSLREGNKLGNTKHKIEYIANGELIVTLDEEPIKHYNTETNIERRVFLEVEYPLKVVKGNSLYTIGIVGAESGEKRSAIFEINGKRTKMSRGDQYKVGDLEINVAHVFVTDVPGFKAMSNLRLR